MKIRSASHSDFEQVLNIYERARAFMREHGNPDQWGDSYPSRDLLLSDLENGRMHLVVDDSSAIAGVFSLFLDGDPDYDVIDGEWLNDEPYIAIHRIASAGTHKGVFSCIFDYCLGLSDNVKIDTHTQNTVMQSVLAKHGFKRCGYITIEGMQFITCQFVKRA